MIEGEAAETGAGPLFTCCARPDRYFGVTLKLPALSISMWPLRKPAL